MEEAKAAATAARCSRKQILQVEVVKQAGSRAA